jgi:predicted transcriptional regulator
MEVLLSPDVQSKLARFAAERGRDAEALAQEAIERFVDYDEWFANEEEKGLAQIARGEVLTHEEVGTRLEKLPVNSRKLKV